MASVASSLKWRLIAPLSERSARRADKSAMARRQNAEKRFESKRAADT